jgi:hypothetical protein
LEHKRTLLPAVDLPAELQVVAQVAQQELPVVMQLQLQHLLVVEPLKLLQQQAQNQIRLPLVAQSFK